MSTEDDTAPHDPYAGAWLFARYAYGPNRLGHCGPAGSTPVLGRGGAEGVSDLAAAAELRELAQGFTGAWPYLEILAKLTGIDDPLDWRVVESYWLGGGVGSAVEQREFAAALLSVIGAQAGHYWEHLTPDILPEVAANHCFHVFGVYPWSRMLDGGAADAALSVLDNCRIRWGRVLSVDDDQLEVLCRRLAWSHGQLGLTELRRERVALSVDGLSFLDGVKPGDQVALHWDWATDWLTDQQVTVLRETTVAQLALTNRRLAPQRTGR